MAALDPELKDRMILALTSTVRGQCRRMYGQADGSRCAMGLIAEAVFGVRLIPMPGDGHLFLGAEDRKRLGEEIGPDRFNSIVWWNDCGMSFDKIAKRIKDERWGLAPEQAALKFVVSNMAAAVAHALPLKLDTTAYAKLTNSTAD